MADFVDPEDFDYVSQHGHECTEFYPDGTCVICGEYDEDYDDYLFIEDSVKSMNEGCNAS